MVASNDRPNNMAHHLANLSTRSHGAQTGLKQSSGTDQRRAWELDHSEFMSTMDGLRNCSRGGSGTVCSELDAAVAAEASPIPVNSEGIASSAGALRAKLDLLEDSDMAAINLAWPITGPSRRYSAQQLAALRHLAAVGPTFKKQNEKMRRFLHNFMSTTKAAGPLAGVQEDEQTQSAEPRQHGKPGDVSGVIKAMKKLREDKERAKQARIQEELDRNALFTQRRSPEPLIPSGSTTPSRSSSCRRANIEDVAPARALAENNSQAVTGANGTSMLSRLNGLRLTDSKSSALSAPLQASKWAAESSEPAPSFHPSQRERHNLVERVIAENRRKREEQQARLANPYSADNLNIFESAVAVPSSGPSMVAAARGSLIELRRQP